MPSFFSGMINCGDLNYHSVLNQQIKNHGLDEIDLRISKGNLLISYYDSIYRAHPEIKVFADLESLPLIREGVGFRSPETTLKSLIHDIFCKMRSHKHISNLMSLANENI